MDTAADYVRNLLLDVLSTEEALACDAVLLSGGLDTSIASEGLKLHITCRGDSKLRTAITLTIDPKQNGLVISNNLFIHEPQDVIYARKIAHRLCLEHHILTPTLDELLAGEALDMCVRVLGTFDGMELRNAVVIATSLIQAKKLGCTRILTGDGADELFAGYSFMHSMSDNDLQRYTQNMIKTMSFCAIPLAAELGIKVWSPFLDPRVIEYATSDQGGSKSIKVGEFSGSVHGKLVLRKAFPEVISAGRKKEPIECGSGTTVLPKLAELLVSDPAFEQEKQEALEKYDLVVRDKEHLLYFRRFRKAVLDSPEALVRMRRYGPDTCPDCKFRLKDGSSFCNVCGLYPARPISK
ncbi:hypothetical protein GGI15_002859 [Coemansia interrupta]|uniref:Asparagine synthetase domain-containing protein n=1 Tax=Coemansia interrupta TaxID=1126814 RepID=A0A9W8HDQ4_9FUNG|nr:hypothetical protein GGI15_002859 [Coemansia interrupta]